MSKFVRKVKKVTKKVGNVALKGAAISAGLIAATAAAEVGTLGSLMFQSDVETAAVLAKHKKDPTPVYVKYGKFGKRMVKTINPVTGEISDYKGNKVPSETIVLKRK